LPVLQAPKLPTIGESVEGSGAVSFAGAGQRGIAQDNGCWGWAATWFGVGPPVGGARFCTRAGHHGERLVRWPQPNAASWRVRSFVDGFREGVLHVWRGA